MSQATIDRMVRDGRLHSRFLPRAGRKPERIYLSEDIERLAREKENRQALRPPSALVVRAAAEVATIRPRSDLLFQAVRQLFADRDAEQRRLFAERDAQIQAEREAERQWIDAEREEAKRAEKLWLSLEEASERSGLARSDLKQLCQDGTIVSRKSGGWKMLRILRKSLEAFEG